MLAYGLFFKRSVRLNLAVRTMLQNQGFGGRWVAKTNFGQMSRVWRVGARICFWLSENSCDSLCFANRLEILWFVLATLWGAQVPSIRPDHGNLVVGWVPNKHLSILAQSQEAINMVLRTEDHQQDTQNREEEEEQKTSDTGYRRAFAAWWLL